MIRDIESYIMEDLENKKMVFIGGPRQVGKTTIAKSIMSKYKNPLYFNFDHPEDRKNIKERNWKNENELLVFDEIHKWRGWKSWIKGIYDVEKDFHKIIVTGSARLDVYRKGGDSLQGRYHYYRLYPFTVSELIHSKSKIPLETLYERGGFPEPLLSNGIRNLKRWRKERIERVVREDVYSLENLKNLYQLELLIDLLIDRIGSPLSIKGLAEDLSVSPITVENWIRILESMYLLFIVRPYHKKLNRAVKREYKIYFYDWAEIKDEGLRLENMVALHLLKHCHFLEDVEGEKMSLCFVKDRDGHETDFLILNGNKPEEILEVKKNDSTPSKNLLYFKNKIGVPRAYQLVYELEKKVLHKDIYFSDFETYFKKLKS